MNLKVPQSSFERKPWSGTSLCSLIVWRASHGRERSQVPYLVSVHGGDEEGEGNGGGRHGMRRWHSILSNHSLLQFHHRRGEGAGPLQDILGHLANVHHQLQNQRTEVSLTRQVKSMNSYAPRICFGFPCLLAEKLFLLDPDIKWERLSEWYLIGKKRNRPFGFHRATKTWHGLTLF